jgi:uncharacterized membrane protein
MRRHSTAPGQRPNRLDEGARRVLVSDLLILVIVPHFVSDRSADLAALVITVATRVSLLPTVLIGIATAGALRHLLS